MEIVRGISQVVANSYDGALDADGEPIKIGLKREEGHPINDSRVMDGFKVSFYGTQLCIHYHAEVKLSEVYANGFESDLEQMIEDRAMAPGQNPFLVDVERVTGPRVRGSQDLDRFAAEPTVGNRTLNRGQRQALLDDDLDRAILEGRN